MEAVQPLQQLHEEWLMDNMNTKYRLAVTFRTGPEKVWSKDSLAEALEDAADLRIAIAGGESKQHIASGGTWHLAPYWEGAEVTVEQQVPAPWVPVEGQEN
jgi:hypothetical protein